ncbi:MAG TPA: IS5 family transposase [Candidatus Acidoferrum sp.]|nr:IS5 family transposase [Candidatus Acidoferrum sp.]
MYRKKDRNQLEFEDFSLPFGGKLRSDNRWMKLVKIIPWDELEDQYATLFSEDQGAPAKSFRMALGALLIKERLCLTDEETVEQIRENPYLQYLVGLTEYCDDAPFDPSMMVHFRKRLTNTIINEINERIVKVSINRGNDTSRPNGDNGASGSDSGELPEVKPDENSGIMMVDASVTPADIAYPTDLNLLNHAREKLEENIDVLYKPHKTEMAKPRTYRNLARRDYLHAAKKRKLPLHQLRKAIRKQLQYLQRDFRHIDTLIDRYNGLNTLTRRQYRDVLVIRELCRQQEYMYRNNTHSIEDRIVSISQPHVRPMVRGKASAAVEFGAKIVVSRVEGYAFLEHRSWDAFNESTLLQDQINGYRTRFGCYPGAVLVDKLYRNRDNIRFCKEHGIRMSGPRLGRPSKDADDDRKREREDSGMRNGIEGTFGTGKRKYGLGRIMTKLISTSESSIAMIILVMNLEKRLRVIFIHLVLRYISAFARLQSLQFEGI